MPLESKKKLEINIKFLSVNSLPLDFNNSATSAPLLLPNSFTAAIIASFPSSPKRDITSSAIVQKSRANKLK